MSRDNRPSELLQGSYTEALESFRNQLKPLGTRGQTAEKDLRVITDVLPNSGNGLKPLGLKTETLQIEVAPTLEGRVESVPAAKLTEQHEYKNAESIEDAKNG